MSKRKFNKIDLNCSYKRSKVEIETSKLRPPVLKIDSESESLVFQEIEIDHYLGAPINNDFSIRGSVPIMRMFGSTKSGNSVCCHVHGFYPYFMIKLPNNFQPEHIIAFEKKLNEAVICDMRSNKENIVKAVMGIEIIMGQSLYGYSGATKSKFAKISVVLPKLIAPAKRLLESINIHPLINSSAVTSYEANVDIEMRFMIDKKIYGCCWIELVANKWEIRSETGRKPITNCQIEVDVDVNDFIAHEPDNEWSDVAPFRFLSFDIECAGRKGIFPEPKVDPIIQIANVVRLHGSSENLICNVFTLGTCAPICHAKVYSFSKESDMLEAWAQFVRDIDPDLFTGYNINNFDFPYLIERAKHLSLENFSYLSRIRNVRSILRENVVQTKVGRRTFKAINFEGRIPYDMYVIVKRDLKLRSYTLNNVCQEILNEQKEDVHYSIITDLHNGDEHTRKRLAVYCVKDADLPMRLINHLNCFTNDIEMARVTGVMLTSLLAKGEQVKVVAQLLRHCQAANYFMPMHQVNLDATEQFEGATVIEPIRGYYTNPIATLDFSSLYPSIMIAHNLCYTTLLNPGDKARYELTDDQISLTPANNQFVKSSVRRGLLPQILESLLSARKRTKLQLKNELDPIKKSVLDGKQLALKISANSVYGFTGAQVGKLPCLQISGSVTAYGRLMINMTKEEVENHFTVANGYESNARVIYGDTDSVMIDFNVKAIEKSMELGREAAREISAKFIDPIKLEFEKVYFPYLLINKKRYAGLYFTRPDKYDKMDCKGIETVRRDNCTLVVDLINTCLQKLLIDRDPDGAVMYAKQIISDLLRNDIDISQLVITKELTKNDYQAKQAHSELAQKMAKRDPGNAPKLGDRIPYVITAASKNTPAFQKAEEPIYVLENNIPIDTRYYLENQISKPLVRIFQPVLGDNAESILLHGDHTRVKTVVTSKVGPMSMFLTRRETCLGCKALLNKAEEKNAICSRCKPNECQVYQQEFANVQQLQKKFSMLFSECQRCQGSIHEEILCTNRDCSIFYLRKKVQVELDAAIGKIKRFGDAF
uniref:DNA polymerase n=1 Tax=Stichotrema asahinai TaxID=911378 RepID=E9RHR5_9NEOP|nr:DNA polymerase delta catalytic subunit [Stichotrema asahinai]